MVSRLTGLSPKDGCVPFLSAKPETTETNSCNPEKNRIKNQCGVHSFLIRRIPEPDGITVFAKKITNGIFMFNVPVDIHAKSCHEPGITSSSLTS
jgi:hypothetical protein